MSTHDDLYAAGRLLLHALHGRAATWTKQSTGATTAITALLRQDGQDAEITVNSSALASAPVKDDSLVFTGATERWFVRRVSESLSLDGDYVLECRSNAAE